MRHSGGPARYRKWKRGWRGQYLQQGGDGRAGWGWDLAGWDPLTAQCTEAIEETDGDLGCGVAAQSCQGGQSEEDIEVPSWIPEIVSK